MRRIVAVLIAATAAVVATGSAAWACGSLVGPNGAVQLVRTSTLAAHHDGFEHYITNFEFASNQETFGSIIPLPAEPTKVERGGDWTLQRLQREVQPPVAESALAARAPAAAADQVEVIEQVRIDSLDVTILKGGGRSVADWAKAQGFTLTEDTPDVLEYYSRRSPFFMAAKFDAAAAVAQGFTSGDGTPVHLTMPMDRPWVPLHILATGKPAEEVVAADVFLLTDEKPKLLAGPGLSLERSEPASELLLDDLRSDRGMAWVPEDAHLTYLRVDVAAGDLDYDLAASATPSTVPTLRDTGLSDVTDVVVPGGDGSTSAAIWPVVAAVGAVLVLAAGLTLSARRVRGLPSGVVRR
jgi:hypothetical protein